LLAWGEVARSIAGVFFSNLDDSFVIWMTDA
jgi:hypothetical protein